MTLVVALRVVDPDPRKGQHFLSEFPMYFPFFTNSSSGIFIAKLGSWLIHRAMNRLSYSSS